jgi:hypothetical protein
LDFFEKSIVSLFSDYPPSMLLIALLVAAAPADEVTLTEELQVKELCAALREQPGSLEGDPAEAASARKAALARRDEALSRWYRLEVPARGFVLGRYNAHEKQLELDGDRPLRSLDGAILLDLEGVDDVAFSARPEQVSAWSKEKKAGALKLVVVWRPSGERCAGSTGTQSFRIAGRARTWQLVGGSGAVASADAEGEPVGALPKAVKVEKVALEADDKAPADDGRARLSSAQRELDRCVSGAQRSGTMVVAFAVQGGRIRDAQVIMDSLRDERVSSCVAHAVGGAPISAGDGRGTAAISLE